VQAFLPLVYGDGEPKFIIGDVQDGFGNAYLYWKDAVGPVLSNFRNALLSKEDRFNAIAQFNGGADIDISFTNDVVPWKKSVESPNTLSGIRLLSEKNIQHMGCFIYKDVANLNTKNLASYAIIVDEYQSPWLTFIQLSADDKSKINKIRISQLSNDWKAYFKRIQFPGGECDGIMSKF
jgi:L-rhamnose mutarotase